MYNVILNNKLLLFCIVLLFYEITISEVHAQNTSKIIIDEHSPYLINETVLGYKINPGDSIFIKSDRTKPLRFEFLEGTKNNPIVVINQGGQVKINATERGNWGAMVFLNSKFIKVSGRGHPGFKYGFELKANEAGLVFGELSSDCEAENIKISYSGFFGILVKKDYHGNPPIPTPVFYNLSIHDCFIENVSEGMYLGETISPGMEFKQVKIFNNIVRNTQRESIQIANMTEDIEIYNNTLINAGLEGLDFHRNNLQIGDNSVANIHHNIMIGAPEYGVINFGKGNVSIRSNYIKNSRGIFCDSRTIVDTLSAISVEDNFFKSIKGSEVIKNRNEYNFFVAENNFFDGDIDFYKDETVSETEYLSQNQNISVPEIHFQDTINNNYKLSSETDERLMGMGAPGGNEFFKYRNAATIPRLLEIRPEMISDSVPGGSIHSPEYLFDEQDVNSQLNEHPVSASWKPDYEMNLASYHAVLDLGDEHYISQIHLHDMDNDYPFEVEYYTNSHRWKTAIIEKGEGYNTWKIHKTNLKTRYLRFSMYESPNAAINEIRLYGYPIVKKSEQILVTPSMITDLVEGGSVDSPNLLFDEQQIDIQNEAHPQSKSWKPFYNESKAPYYALVDLGKEYHISKIKLHDMNDTKDFIIQYGDGENWNDLIHENCDGFKVWKKHYTNVVTRYLRLVMPTSPYASINEMVLYGYPVISFPNSQIGQFQKIPIEPYMVNDLVKRGSVSSPNYLFDEQEIDPFSNQYPVSKSWKPYYDETKAPYYAELNLLNTYKISQILLYHMYHTKDFSVEYKDAYNNWVPSITEPSEAYKVWKTHNVNITTNKLRFVISENPNVGINEIILYGNLVYQQSGKPMNALVNSANLEIYPNPVTNKIYIKGIQPDARLNQFEILDYLGKNLYINKNADTLDSNTLVIHLDAILLDPGIYFLQYKNDKGQQKTFQFLKTN